MNSNRYGANSFFTAPNFLFSAASPSDWMLFIGPHLYVTHDAGVNWTTLTPTPAIGRVYALAQTSATRAWAAVTVPTCSPVRSNHCTIAAFVHSSDGGETWPAFYPH